MWWFVELFVIYNKIKFIVLFIKKFICINENLETFQFFVVADLNFHYRLVYLQEAEGDRIRYVLHYP